MNDTILKANLPDELLEKLPAELNAQLQEYHCAKCGRFLAFFAIVEGTVVIKCRRCKEMNVLDLRQVLTEPVFSASVDTKVEKS